MDWVKLRDMVLFFAGIAGIAFETIFRRPPDYGMLPVYAGMCGLPAFLSRKDKDDEDAHAPAPVAVTQPEPVVIAPVPVPAPLPPAPVPIAIAAHPHHPHPLLRAPTRKRRHQNGVVQ